MGRQLHLEIGGSYRLHGPVPERQLRLPLQETERPSLHIRHAAGAVGLAVVEGIAAFALFLMIMLLGLWAAAFLADIF